MNPPDQPAPPAVAVPRFAHPPTPLYWRALILAVAGGIGAGPIRARYPSDPATGPRVQAGLGALCFLTLAAAFSTNLRAVNWRTIGMGIALQLVTAWVVLRNEYGPGCVRGSGEGGHDAVRLRQLRGQIRLRPARRPADVWSKVLGPGQRLHLRVHGPAADHFRLVVLHGALLLRRAAMGRPHHGQGHDVPAGHQRGGDAVGVGERVHGPDGGAADRQAVRRRG